LLSSHQAITRVAVAAVIFTFVIALSPQEATQAAPEVSRPVPQSLLPASIGSAVPATDAVLVAFDEPMDPASVEAALQLVPAEDARLAWNAERTELSIEPEGRWRTDESYLVIVGTSAATADGTGLSAPRQFAFSTQTAPTVSSFQVRPADALMDVGADAADAELAALRLEEGLRDVPTLSLTETARDVSPTSAVRISFSAPMSRADVEERFSITPEVPGALSWVGQDLVFSPTERLEPGRRYTISLLGAHDRSGNELGGKATFSFLVRAAPQLVSTAPALGAQDVEAATVEMWFSQPMNVDATNAAFSLTDTSTGRLVAGWLNWNETATQLVYSPDRAFAGGRTYEVALGAGAADAAGNPLATTWSFTTRAAPAAEARAAAAAERGSAPPPVAFVPMEASGLEGYAINQINAARAAYGFGPLALDWTMSAVAAAHAWDQLNYGYYSHTGRDGSSVFTRLAAGGVGFSAAGENACHASMGLGAQGTMDWCHGVFMSEPWPGHPNHIGNILSNRYTRVGIGVADNGSRVVITWDFAN
jgi:uncharacterized protein YkwD